MAVTLWKDNSMGFVSQIKTIFRHTKRISDD